MAVIIRHGQGNLRRAVNGAYRYKQAITSGLHAFASITHHHLLSGLDGG